MVALRSRPHQHPQADQRQRHRHRREDADRNVGVAPAHGLDAVVDQRRPDRAADVIAAGGNGDREPAVAVEPVRGFRHQRSEGGRRGQPDREMHQDELPDRGRHSRDDIAQAQNADAEPDGGDDAVAVGDLAGQHRAGAESEHDHRERQRGGAAARGELGLHHGKCDHHRPHADAAERADQHGHGKPDPCPARVGNEQVGISGELRRNCHGGRNFGGKSPNVKPHCRDIGHADVMGQRPQCLVGPLAESADGISLPPCSFA